MQQSSGSHLCSTGLNWSSQSVRRPVPLHNFLLPFWQHGWGERRPSQIGVRLLTEELVLHEKRVFQGVAIRESPTTNWWCCLVTQMSTTIRAVFHRWAEPRRGLCGGGCGQSIPPTSHQFCIVCGPYFLPSAAKGPDVNSPGGEQGIQHVRSRSTDTPSCNSDCSSSHYRRYCRTSTPSGDIADISSSSATSRNTDLRFGGQAHGKSSKLTSDIHAHGIGRDHLLQNFLLMQVMDCRKSRAGNQREESME